MSFEDNPFDAPCIPHLLNHHEIVDIRVKHLEIWG